jgi:hypothetical protein
VYLLLVSSPSLITRHGLPHTDSNQSHPSYLKGSSIS